MKVGILSNKYCVGAFFLGVFLLALVLFVPFLQGAFSVTALTSIQLGFVVLFAFIPTFIIQIFKSVRDNVIDKNGKI